MLLDVATRGRTRTVVWSEVCVWIAEILTTKETAVRTAHYTHRSQTFAIKAATMTPNSSCGLIWDAQMPLSLLDPHIYDPRCFRRSNAG